MSKFKVGDKVRDSLYEEGTVVEVCFAIMPQIPYRVAFKNKWMWLAEDRLTPLETTREFIVIHRDSNVMTAEHRVNRDVIESAKATCAPSDTFDFNTGAKLAFDRLMGRAEPKPAPQPAHRFKVGDRVVHKEYGMGTILQYISFHPDVPYLVKPDNEDCYCNHWAEENVSPAPEPPKFYTGKVVCIHNATVLFRDIFPVGLIVTIKDGKITSFIIGKEMRVDYVKKETNEIKSVDDLNNRFYKDILFAEVKETSDV